MKSKRPATLGNKSASGRTLPTAGFDVLIARAALLFVVGASDETDDRKAIELYQQAMDRMVEAGCSPFFGRTKMKASDEGLEVVRELVFERVGDEPKRCEYQI